MPANYGYINARVRGMKAKLLGEDFYNQAINSESFQGFANALASSPSYAPDIEEAQAQHEGLQMVDEAISRNFYRTSRSLLAFADGQPEKLIQALLLRYDLQNLKALARSKHAGRSAEDAKAALFPAGRLKLALLEDLADAEDMAALGQKLNLSQHPLAADFAKALKRYQQEHDLYALELELDTRYYARIFSELDNANAPKELVRFMQREVDATNIRTALKLQGAENADDSYALFIAGGREISKDKYSAIQSENLSVLASTSFKDVADSEGLSQAEEAIRQNLAEQARRLHMGSPLDIGVVLNFLKLKEDETAKLRLLARGKFYGVKPEALLREMGRS